MENQTIPATQRRCRACQRALRRSDVAYAVVDIEFCHDCLERSRVQTEWDDLGVGD